VPNAATPVTVSISKLLTALDAAAKGVEDARSMVKAAKAVKDQTKEPSFASRVVRAVMAAHTGK
jgi:hypothetical protein